MLSIWPFNKGFDTYVIVDNIEQLESAEVMDVDHQAPFSGNTDTGEDSSSLTPHSIIYVPFSYCYMLLPAQ